MTVAEQIKSDSRVEKIAELDGGRLLLKLPVPLIEHHTLLQKIRGKAPEIERLHASLKETADAPVYPILIYAAADEKGKVHYFVADGHQRLRAAVEARSPWIYGQVVTRWTDAHAAFNECVSIQYARFEMRDIDLFSIMREGKLTDQELIRMTGKSESTIVRMRKVSGHTLLVELIDKEVITTNLAANLIDKTDKNSEKVSALMATLSAKYEEAKKEAAHWNNRFNAEGKPKNRKLADKAKVATYFKNADEWAKITDALTSDNAIDPDTGMLNVDKKVARSKATIVVADTATSWEEEIAIYFEGGQKHQDISLENLRRFRESLPTIEKNLNVIIQRRAAAEAAQQYPMPPGNPTVKVEAPPKPKKQSASMKVEE